MSKRIFVIPGVFLAWAIGTFFANPSAYSDDGQGIRLVVHIVVDGLPAETLFQHEKSLLAGGLGRFFKEGTVCARAEYPYLTTYTAVGHASLHTGALPSVHGIIGNEWLDNTTGEEVYSVEDERHVLLGAPNKPHEGTSPRNLCTTTIGDELIRASGKKSRVFSVSGKDRAAILSGGHFGKSFWYSKTAGEFVSSDYYYPVMPEWLTAWQQQHLFEAYRNQTWQRVRDKEAYSFRDPDNGHFLHNEWSDPDVAIGDAIRWTPFLDELTLSLADEILESQHLGQGDACDMLCISLSSMDFISHRYGPDSPEAEDVLYRVDNLLSDFFAHIDHAIGLNHAWVVVTADHGFGRIPENAAREGLPACRLSREELDACINDLRARLMNTYKLPPESVHGYLSPFFYLDDACIIQAGLSLSEVRDTAADIIASFPGVACAISRERLCRNEFPFTDVYRRALASIHPCRGGDVLVALKPWSQIETSENAYPATHGSHYSYDTQVPVLFLGKDIPSQRIYRAVSPLDIAPSIAMRLAITPPPGCIGSPLSELFNTAH